MFKFEESFEPSFLKKKDADIPAPLPADPALAMAYVPFQQSNVTYDEMEALKQGTLFPVLNKVFRGRGTKK